MSDFWTSDHTPAGAVTGTLEATPLSTPPSEQAAANDPAVTGLGEIDRAGGRVSVSEKRMINARADVNQLLPLKYTWRGRSTWPGATTTGCPPRYPCRPTSPCGSRRAAPQRLLMPNAPC